MAQPQILPDIVIDTELKTVLTSEHTIHTYYVSDPKPRKVEEVWRRGRLLGKSVATVWLETCIASKEREVGQCRAVKEVRTDSHSFSTSEVARELEAIGRLSQKTYRHRFVRSSGWWRIDTSVFIAMEYLPLGDLSRYLKQPIPEIEAIEITHQLLEGLKFMHELGFAHRDLKPKNVLVQVASPDWYVKIADFGISKRVRNTTTHTGGIGTVTYMAPEAITNKVPDLHVYAIDIWAIGVMSWQMVTTQVLFPTLSDILSYAQSPTLLHLDTSALSTDYGDFLIKCLAPSAGERIKLEDALKHTWLTPATELISEPTPNFTRSNNTRWSATAASTTQSVPTYSSWETRLEDTTEYLDREQSQHPSLKVDLGQRQMEAPQGLSEWEERDKVQRCGKDDSTTLEATKPTATEQLKSETVTALQGDQSRQTDSSIWRLDEAGAEFCQVVFSGNFERFQQLLPRSIFITEAFMNQIRQAVNLGLTKVIHNFIQLTPLSNNEAVSLRMLLLKVTRFNRAHYPGLDASTEQGYPQIIDSMGRTLLHNAVVARDIQAVTILLAAGAATSTLDLNQCTPLHYAVEASSTSFASLLLAAGADPSPIGKDLETPLHKAAWWGLSAMVDLLTKAGARVAAKGRKERAPLFLAASNGHVEAADVLIQAGADVDAKDHYSNTPLHAAARYKHINIMRLLVKNSASLDIQDKTGCTALHHAAGAGTAGLIRFLVDAGAALDVKNYQGKTPRDLALEKNYAEAVEALDQAKEDAARRIRHRGPLDQVKPTVLSPSLKKTDPSGFLSSELPGLSYERPQRTALHDGHPETWKQDPQDQQSPVPANTEALLSFNQRRTRERLLPKEPTDGMPLHQAASKGDMTAIKALLLDDVSANLKDEDGWTPLHYAISHGQKKAADVLIGNKASVKAKTSSGRAPLHVAANGGHVEIIDCLLRAQADVKVVDNRKSTPLHLAAINGFTQAVQVLLDAGAINSAQNMLKMTPLHEAADYGHTDTIRALLQVSPSAVMAKCDMSRRPLHYAARGGHLEAMKILIKAETSPSKGFESVLAMAVSSSEPEAASLLLGLRADPDRYQKYGDGQAETLLTNATGRSNVAMVKVLLQGRANPDLVSKPTHRTPLAIAANSGQAEIVQLLLNAGASSNIPDEDGFRAIHLAVLRDRVDCVRIMLEAGVPADQQTSKRLTPLHLAAKRGNVTMIRLLLDAGAGGGEAKRFGGSTTTPQQLALNAGHEEAAAILSDAARSGRVVATDGPTRGLTSTKALTQLFSRAVLGKSEGKEEEAGTKP